MGKIEKLNHRELKSIGDFVVALAREAGEIQRRHLGQSKPIAYKGPVDLVTEVDHLCEDAIIGRILDRFPRHHVLAEEGEHKPQGESSFRWYVDPLDGTTNYVHGYPCFSVSIGLEVEAEMVLGVVYDPMGDELFHGIKDHGAFLNGRKINVSKIRALEQSLLATGFPYDIRESEENNIDHFAKFALASQGVRRDGSAALDLCYVAIGRFDGFWEMKLRPWDVAAGVVMVREAGGRVSDFRNAPFSIDSGEVLATNGLIHGQMVSLLERGRIKRLP
ncbi:MAG: inositol monophosphatase [Proteobacteria bacterium]|nr:inositol monophosphatase [Pseudomonadota bacterium]NIS69739.1 inositol monophosphatase [Pseudomonadota bacterium]